MIHQYKIGGMTCESCAAKVKSAFLSMPDVLSATVDKTTDTATIEMSKHISVEEFSQQLKSKDPKYAIVEMGHHDMMDTDSDANGLSSYKPIFLIFFYITAVTLFIQWTQGSFEWMEWMRHFMAGFFLVFSFFKLLDLSGFADSYMSYDIIAKRWRGWGYVYGFLELFLGLAYLTNCCPLLTNVFAFTLMSISIIGVLQSVLNKRKIQCACLGAVFDLPMSTITIIEDALMILMSGMMILQLTT